MEHLSSILFLLLIIFFALLSESKVFNVVNYGAVGDGLTDDTDALAKAWEETCTMDSSSPVMQIPEGKTFLIQPLRFNGPCNSKSITVQIDGNLVAPENPSDWSSCNGEPCQEWIHFFGVDGLSVVGRGTIDGRGQKWWDMPAFQIAAAKNVYFGDGLRFKDSPQMHIVLNGLSSVLVSNITIVAPGKSPNTDGIHVVGCTKAVIDRAWIGTGDDCISIVDKSSYVWVSNIVCGPGHGISIGSLGKNGAEDKVEKIAVVDVVFIGTQNGARIKTWQGGKGYARHIIFERILYHRTANPIIIDQFYCDHQECVESESAVKVSGVTFKEVVGTSSTERAVTLMCSEAVPCQDIILDDIHIRTTNDEEPSYECQNVRGRASGDKVPELSCLK
ncbi:probable polygalacturonase At1g80170 isoform X2 [Andrographis paniculata]|uniref:probable polygalacturonase At1g80170 isoform X2 n=1 Tax=Andrographis paniculata TaxID=175694 RepID=UPI0021E890A5|nr:probable polygalacturonase At1g80170 isoform X2 [Andrographis paniculata]